MTNLPHTRRTSRSLSNPLRSSALLAGILVLPAAAQDGERPDFAALKAEGARRSRYLEPDREVNGAGARGADLETFRAEIEPILAGACLECHGEQKQKGGFRLDELDPDLVAGEDVDWWMDVRAALVDGDMPPDGEESLSAEDRGRVIDWLTAEAQAASQARQGAREHSTFRRLARYEYDFALRDLLGVARSFGEELPPDPISEDGFENSAEVLQLSTTQFEAYLDAARAALAHATVTGERPAPLHWSVSMDAAAEPEWRRQDGALEGIAKKHAEDPEKLEAELEKRRQSHMRRPGGTHFEQRSTGRFARATWGYNGATRAFAPQEGEPAPPVESDAVAVLPAGAGLIIELGDRLPEEGVMRVRVRAERGADGDERTPSLRLMFGWQASNDSNAVFRAEVEDALIEAPPGEPATYEWRVPMGTIDVRNLARGVNKMGELPSPSEYIKLVNSSMSGREVRLHHVEVTAPFTESWPPASHRRVFEGDPGRGREEARVRAILEVFMARAWRRPVSRSEVRRMVKLFRRIRPSAESFEEATVEVLAVTLASPNFLYVVRGAEEGRASDHELATRLALFLWCSVPDDALLAAADSGALAEPESRAREIERMLADPRARRMPEVFVDQWLDLGLMENLEIDTKVHQGFDGRLKESMTAEPVAFFAELLATDESVLSLIHSDFTMVDERLARHYGLKGVAGHRMQRVELDPDGRRGGLLGQAGPLAMNSDGKDSHPLKRGIWVLENLLDDPPPPPPPAVPEIDVADPRIAEMTLKERLEDHRNDPACMSCHSRIDPWGIAFEHFDATGRWRDDVEGRPVDAVSLLAGERELDGLDGLKAFLLEERQDQFVRALAKKMTTFALGRPLGFGDEAGLEGIVSRTRRGGDGLATMVEAIVSSELFLER